MSMTNDVHSLIARARAPFSKCCVGCDVGGLRAIETLLRDEDYTPIQAERDDWADQVGAASDKIQDTKALADDAEKMLGLLLEAREKDVQVCDYDFINTGGLPKYEDGPLGKKIAEFLEGK